MDINFVVIFFSFVRLLLILGLFDKPLLVMQVGRQADVSKSKSILKDKLSVGAKLLAKEAKYKAKKLFILHMIITFFI